MKLGLMRIAPAVALLFSGLIAWPALALDSDPTWGPRGTVAYTYNTSGYAGADRYLAYDHLGIPGVAVSQDNPTTDYVGLSRRLPGYGWMGWTGMGISAACPSVVYDRYERPLLSYVDAANTDLKFSSWSGSAWNTVTVNSDAQGYASLALDLYGRPAMVWHQSSSSAVKYIHDTDGDGDWTDETVRTVSSYYGAYGSPKLAFDSANRPVVAYSCDAGAGDAMAVMFATYEGNTWGNRFVAQGELKQYTLSLAVDPDNDYPAVAYGESDGDLFYTTWDGDFWQTEKVADGFQPSLVFDPSDGEPVIAYRREAGGLGLAYLDADDGVWENQVVDGTVGVGLWPSLAFNPYGDEPLGIAYMNASGTIYYMQDPPIVPEPATLGLVLLGCAAVTARRRISRRKP